VILNVKRVDVASIDNANALILQFAYQCQGLFVQITKICTTKLISYVANSNRLINCRCVCSSTILKI
jgi:hypothetical protein